MRKPTALRKPTARSLILTISLIALSALAAACSKGASEGAELDRLTVGFYTTPREVYGKSILPAFKEAHRERTGRVVEIHDSYLGSGAQARAIVGGFEADIAALSLLTDLEQIAKAGLITHDVQAGDYRGIVTRSLVVIGVREGNPKQIRDFADLARPGVSLLTPNVRMSGGAMWNFLALYGAAQRGRLGGANHASEEGITEAEIEAQLAAILRNVTVMDRGARESTLNFERGIGDAIITYENELLTSRAAGHQLEIIIPSSTILIENPVALVDANVDKHGTRELAQRFIDFLYTERAQRAFAEAGYRPVRPDLTDEFSATFPPVDALFRTDDLGGWEKIHADIFAPGALYDRVLERSRKR